MSAPPNQVDPVTLGNRLKSARETAGMTQVRAADELGVVRTTIVAIEKGQRRVKPEELVRLARLYGESVGRMLRPTALVPDLVLQYRRSQTRPTSDDEAVEATKMLQQLAAAYVELEERLGVRLAAHYPAEYRIRRGRLAEQAEDLAQEVRRLLGNGPRAPLVDLERLLESEMGFRIFTRSLPSQIAGAFAFHEALGPCVLLNAKHPVQRRLWTLAHELGHFITSRHSVDVLRTDEDVAERFSDLFAGSLILPAAEMRRRVDQHEQTEGKFSARHLIYLAATFGASLEAIARTLEKLGLLDSGTFDLLRERGLNQQVVRDVLQEEDDPQPRSPSRFSLLAAEAFDKDLLSEGQVASMLGLGRVEVRAILDEVTDVGMFDDLPR